MSQWLERIGVCRFIIWSTCSSVSDMRRVTHPCVSVCVSSQSIFQGWDSINFQSENVYVIIIIVILYISSWGLSEGNTLGFPPFQLPLRNALKILQHIHNVYRCIYPYTLITIKGIMAVYRNMEYKETVHGY